MCSTVLHNMAWYNAFRRRTSQALMELDPYRSQDVRRRIIQSFTIQSFSLVAGNGDMMLEDSKWMFL